ncbi:MAG: hypothetical protein DRI71_00995 [Bacteroidetes bacterium]|nr:MAG: hypothetical protein DRI71_00995 [Bacteroidota bacterium]
MTLNPGNKGWLAEYLEFRKEMFLSFFKDTAQDRHPEESLYRLLRPNGILYGHPILADNNPQEADISNLNKMKILMAESLINGSLILHHQEVNNEDDFSEVIMKTVTNIGDFYNKVYPDLSVSSRTLFGRKKSPLEIAEKILEKRILLNESNGDFWINFFNNSLLFLDIYFFGQWMHANIDKNVAVFFKTEKDTLRFSVVKVLAAAAHANKIIEEEEQGLFNYFLDSSHLNDKQKEEARIIFKDGVEIDEIDLPTHNSWILKKYFLELAILTVWADRKLEDTEYEFLQKFNSTLGFYEEDLENSLLAVEGFVLEHWEYLEVLRSEHDYSEVSREYVGRIRKMAERNAMRIAAEMQGKSDLNKLLEKAKADDLSDKEAAQLKDDLIAILRKVPTFVIIGLPTTFLTLPMLLKILPSNLGPKE